MDVCVCVSEGKSGEGMFIFSSSSVCCCCVQDVEPSRKKEVLIASLYSTL